jgi:hypothetical protein
MSTKDTPADHKNQLKFTQYLAEMKSQKEGDFLVDEKVKKETKIEQVIETSTTTNTSTNSSMSSPNKFTWKNIIDTQER